MSALGPLSALACAALMLLSCGGEPPPAAPPRASAPPPAWEGTIVALGDSLTAGYGLAESEAWPALLERRLAAEGRRWRVVNSGVSGETSTGALARVDWVLQQLRPDVVILETGANDGLRGIAPGIVRGNVIAAARRLQAGGAVVVIAGMRMLRNLGEEYTREFAAIYPAAAAETGAVLIPFLLEGVAAVPGLNLPDGIHPNAEGQRRLLETVHPYVVKSLPARGNR